MILAAGLGTRLEPLSSLRPKPALPVRDRPVIAYLMDLLARHGIREVMINLHHLPNLLRDAVERHKPAGVTVHYSFEDELLDTGGGIRRAADFLREDDEALVMAGDMLLDVDLDALLTKHRERENRVSLLLVDDGRGERMGTVGFDAEGSVRRFGRDFDLGGEIDSGVFASLRIFARRAFDDLPDRECFQDLRDWFAPQLVAGARDIRALRLSGRECVWSPVGTPREYLEVNLHPPHLDLGAGDPAREFTEEVHDDTLILGTGASMGSGCRLQRVVVWDGERVPDGFVASDGVFAGGRFHPVAVDDPQEERSG